MLETILTAVLVSVATAVVGIIGKAVNDWSAREKAKAEAQVADIARYDAIEALEMGVVSIGETVVKEIKEKASDGKLSRDDIRDVQHKALTQAIDIATNPKAIDFLTETAFNAIAAIITSIVQGGKKEAT